MGVLGRLSHYKSKKGYPFEVELPEEGIPHPDGGYLITGGILTNQIKSLDWEARYLKILMQYRSKDNQLDGIIDECLAKIQTYLT